jgi:uncharacterized membrane protein
MADRYPEGWENWPTMTIAAESLGVSRKKLSELIRSGQLKKYTGPRGIPGGYRVNPEEVELFAEQLADAEDAAETAKPADAPSTAEVVRASIDGAKQAQAHAERLITLFDAPYKFVLDTLRDENTALRAELLQMRSERASQEAVREQNRQQQTLEAMALTELKTAAATKAEAIDLLKKLAVPMMAKHLGVADPRMVALQEALAAIPRESFAVLFKMGVLPPEAEAKLKIGLDWQDAPEAEAAQ